MPLRLVRSNGESASSKSPGADEPGRVLVAHGEDFERQSLERLLEAHGHRVVLASSGDEALALVEAFQPDVALLDVALPGIDGLEACRRIKKTPRLAVMPVILIRATSRSSERKAGIEAGADDFIRVLGSAWATLLRVRNAIRFKRLHEQTAHEVGRLTQFKRMGEDLTAMVVHDMRGPLTGLGGYAELLKTQVGDKETALRFVHRIEGCAQSLAEMVTDLLDVSRLEVGRLPLSPSRVTLEELACQAIEVLGHSQDEGRVTVQGETADGPATCDSDLVRRVLQNLIGNALKFSTPDKPVEVVVSGDDRLCRVDVRDHGPGIPPGFQQKIFEKFAQAQLRRDLRGQSAGLGLTFCKLAVEAHKGRIGVTSRPGQGSTFWFEIPRSPAIRWSFPVEDEQAESRRVQMA